MRHSRTSLSDPRPAFFGIDAILFSVRVRCLFSTHLRLGGGGKGIPNATQANIALAGLFAPSRGEFSKSVRNSVLKIDVVGIQAHRLACDSLEFPC